MAYLRLMERLDVAHSAMWHNLWSAMWGLQAALQRGLSQCTVEYWQDKASNARCALPGVFR